MKSKRQNGRRGCLITLGFYRNLIRLCLIDQTRTKKSKHARHYRGKAEEALSAPIHTIFFFLFAGEKKKRIVRIRQRSTGNPSSHLKALRVSPAGQTQAETPCCRVYQGSSFSKRFGNRKRQNRHSPSFKR